MKTGLFRPLPYIFRAYLSLVAATGSLAIVHENRIRTNTMLGYWHGDSCCMQLVLRKIAKKQDRLHVIVTADKRGDVIEKMITPYKAKALRLPDGLKMRPFFKELLTFAKTEEGILAAALDGPLGPRHEPKRLLFLLASEAQKPVICVHFQYKRIIRLKRRWDQYVIPLPFCKITAVIEELGTITKADLKHFDRLSDRYSV
ncbi:MAG: hypothetical protein E7255_01805 [Lachnospiraceae bacterium]|nr:hypothetical protein [Lachnospiraceae bacterium]